MKLIGLLLNLAAITDLFICTYSCQECIDERIASGISDIRGRTKADESRKSHFHFVLNGRIVTDADVEDWSKKAKILQAQLSKAPTKTQEELQAMFKRSLFVLASPRDPLLTLTLTDHTVVRYTNQSLIVECRCASPDMILHWKSPKGEIIKEHKGRIHIEQSISGDLKLYITHIWLADHGEWTCEAFAKGETDTMPVTKATETKSFDLKVYQKITFTDNATILTVKEGNNATIYCEVKGEPQPNITWNFNGQPINTEEGGSISKFKLLEDGLFINKVTQNDTGEYTCRAIQVSPITSDMQERTVLMKIEHKPFWTHKHHLSLQYAYINGTVTISCEAIAEPPANFSWYRNKKKLRNDQYYQITAEPYMSELTINVHDKSVYDTYRCKVQNSQGNLERNTVLEQGAKPPVPLGIQLRGFNSNTFDIVLTTGPMPVVRTPMDVNGFRIEYMTDYEFRSNAGKWTNAKRKNFDYQDDAILLEFISYPDIGATFLIGNLEPNTTYYTRAASKNVAGYSDWTKVEKFRTLSNEPPSSAPARVEVLSLAQILCVAMTALCLSKELCFGFQSVSRITNNLKRYL